MNCPKCDHPLRISGSKLTSELNTTDVYSEMQLVCVNDQCANYAGTDLNNPLRIVHSTREKVN